jgi:hypothetical protein
MELLDKDSFEMLATLLDGRDTANCRIVCRAWKERVDGNAQLQWKRKMHLIILPKIEQLHNVMSKTPLVPLSHLAANTWLENIMWFEYGQNIYDLIDRDWTEFIYSILPVQEGCWGLLQHPETKQLIYVNNFYGSHTKHCSKIFNHGLEVYTCTGAEHITDRIAQFNNVFPDLIANWKLIHFPVTKKSPAPTFHGQGFHRGSAFYLVLNPGRITDAYPITSRLRRMKKAQPDRLGYVGRGKKRRMVLQPRDLFLKSAPHQLFKKDRVQTHGAIKQVIESYEWQRDVHLVQAVPTPIKLTYYS